MARKKPRAVRLRKIDSRISTLESEFVRAIIPRTADPNAQADLYGRFGIDPDKCVYCGGDSHDDDHLRPLVRERRPTGYFDTVENRVPCCGPCNQSKGGSDWRAWIEGNALNSPTTRKVTDLKERIARLAAFVGETEKPTIALGEMAEIVGLDLWNGYWERLSAIAEALKAAQKDAEKIRPILQAEFERRVKAASARLEEA